MTRAVAIALSLLASVSANGQAESPADSSVRVLVLVDPELRNNVRATAATRLPSMHVIFPGESDADRHDFRIDLVLQSSVDRSRQNANRDGANMMGPVGWMMGSITPWKCPTTHTLTAIVMNNSGERLGTTEVQKVQTRVGTMLKCSDVAKPSEAIVSEMVGDFLQRFRDEWMLPEPDPQT